MDLRSNLKESFQGVLPHLDELTSDLLLDFLIKQGVKKLADLRHISVELLKQVLDHVDASELFDEWQKNYGNRNTAGGSSSSTSDQPSSSSSRVVLGNLQANAQRIATELPVFNVDSPYMPSLVKKAIQDKERPPCSAREDMVKRIYDRCIEVVPNLDRSHFDVIAKQIVSFYPESFKDTICVSDHGSDSLSRQLKIKWDNEHRAKGVVRTDLEKEAPNVKESVGCRNWNPSMPEEETEDSQNKLMQDLKKMFRISQKNWEWSLIKKKLTSSYFLQRKDINGKLAEAAKKKPSRKRSRKDAELDEEDEEGSSHIDLSIVEIQERWPFLFTAQGISIHFRLLTGIDFPTAVDEWISSKGPSLIDFLASRSDELLKMKKQSDTAQRFGFGGVTLSAVLLMLIKFFREERNHFVTFVERTTELNEVASKVSAFPDCKTPLLIFAGPNIFDFEKIFFACDNKVLSTAQNLMEGLSLLFCSYYVFNYVYSPNLSCFLTFIQRAILNINPKTGSRCADARITKIANNKVLQLSNKFSDFDQDNSNEENFDLM